MDGSDIVPGRQTPPADVGAGAPRRASTGGAASDAWGTAGPATNADAAPFPSADTRDAPLVDRRSPVPGLPTSAFDGERPAAGDGLWGGRSRRRSTSRVSARRAAQGRAAPAAGADIADGAATDDTATTAGADAVADADAATAVTAAAAADPADAGALLKQPSGGRKGNVRRFCAAFLIPVNDPNEHFAAAYGKRARGNGDAAGGDGAGADGGGAGAAAAGALDMASAAATASGRWAFNPASMTFEVAGGRSPTWASRPGGGGASAAPRSAGVTTKSLASRYLAELGDMDVAMARKAPGGGGGGGGGSLGGGAPATDAGAGVGAGAGAAAAAAAAAAAVATPLRTRVAVAADVFFGDTSPFFAPVTMEQVGASVLLPVWALLVWRVALCVATVATLVHRLVRRDATMLSVSALLLPFQATAWLWLTLCGLWMLRHGWSFIAREPLSRVAPIAMGYQMVRLVWGVARVRVCGGWGGASSSRLVRCGFGACWAFSHTCDDGADAVCFFYAAVFFCCGWLPPC